MGYRLTRLARSQLLRELSYIVDAFESEPNSQIVEDYLADAFELIGKSPKAAGRWRDRYDPGHVFRFRTEGKYLIVYRDPMPTDAVVEIVALYGTGRDLDKILAKLLPRLARPLKRG